MVTNNSLTGQESSFSAPQTLVRETSDTVVTGNGQTIVLGGLSENTTSNTQTRVPGHGLLSNLFKSNEDGLSNRQFVILLRAELVTKSSINRQVYNIRKNIL